MRPVGEEMTENFKIREKIKIVFCSFLCSLDESWKFHNPTADCIRRCKGKMRKEKETEREYLEKSKKGKK